MQTDYGRKIVKNTFFVATAYVFGLAVAFVITPYVIYKLGIVRFGIWALIKVFFGYLGLLELGINFSFIKFISHYYTKGEYQPLNRLLSTGICFNILFGLLVFGIVLLTRNIFLNIFDIDVGLKGETSRTLLIVGLFFVIQIPFKVFSSLIDGMQRFEISRSILILAEIINAVSTFVALELGYKLDGLIFMNGVAYFFIILLIVFVSVRIYPEMKINIFGFDRRIFKELFSYGIRVQVSQLARIIHFEVDKLILGIFLNPAVVGFYEVGAKINRALKMMPTFTLFAVLPASSEMHATGDDSKLMDLYIYGSKFMALINIFLSIIAFTLAPQIIYLWMGPGYEMSVTVVRMLIFAYSISVMISAFGMEVARGIGNVDYEKNASLYQAVANILMSVVLTYLYGLKGALWGTVISALTGSFYFLYMFHRNVIPYSLKLLFKNIYEKPLYLGVLLFLIIVITNNYVMSSFSNLSRLNTALYVVTISAFTFFTFSFLILQSKYFSRMELSKILDSMSPWAGVNARVVKFIYGEQSG
jgi:O-antigen/teichoic acid export membrane protein